MQRASLASALLLCSLCSFFAQPSQAFLDGTRGAGAYISRLLGEGYSDEKVPMAVVVPSVPDLSPLPAPTAAAVAAPTPTPAPAPLPVPGKQDYMPKLPSERLSPRAPASGNAGAPAPAAPGDGASTAFISSNPAVPLPAGVTDSATVLPMPTPGQEQRQWVGLQIDGDEVMVEQGTEVLQRTSLEMHTDPVGPRDIGAPLLEAMGGTKRMSKIKKGCLGWRKTTMKGMVDACKYG